MDVGICVFFNDTLSYAFLEHAVFINQLTMASICPFISISAGFLKKEKGHEAASHQSDDLSLQRQSYISCHALWCQLQRYRGGLLKWQSQQTAEGWLAVWTALQNHRLLSVPDSSKTVVDYITSKVPEPHWYYCNHAAKQHPRLTGSM